MSEHASPEHRRALGVDTEAVGSGRASHALPERVLRAREDAPRVQVRARAIWFLTAAGRKKASRRGIQHRAGPELEGGEPAPPRPRGHAWVIVVVIECSWRSRSS